MLLRPDMLDRQESHGRRSFSGRAACANLTDIYPITIVLCHVVAYRNEEITAIDTAFMSYD